MRLFDFGLALMADADTLTAVGDVPGTLAYISPERLHGQEAGPAADVWAVGVLLWEALAGHHPFWRTSPLETGRGDQDRGAFDSRGAARPAGRADRGRRRGAVRRPRAQAGRFDACRRPSRGVARTFQAPGSGTAACASRPEEGGRAGRTGCAGRPGRGLDRVGASVLPRVLAWSARRARRRADVGSPAPRSRAGARGAGVSARQHLVRAGGALRGRGPGLVRGELGRCALGAAVLLRDAARAGRSPRSRAARGACRRAVSSGERCRRVRRFSSPAPWLRFTARRFRSRTSRRSLSGSPAASIRSRFSRPSGSGCSACPRSGWRR